MVNLHSSMTNLMYLRKHRCLKIILVFIKLDQKWILIFPNLV